MPEVKMKKYKILFCSLLLILGTAGALYAFSFTDVRAVNRWLKPGESVFMGFNYDQSRQVDRVSIDFEDDGDRANEYSNVHINQSLLARFEVNDGTLSWNLASLRNFNLNVFDRSGTFKVKRISTFGTCKEPPSTSVPEPGTMLSLGFVLLGLVVVSRKRFRKEELISN
jgi:hypothetical protein